MRNTPDIRIAIQSHVPALIPAGSRRQAAVAMLLADLDFRPRMFFIERARNPDDPWSGQIAFPGGNLEPADADTFDTARRETLEKSASRFGRTCS